MVLEKLHWSHVLVGLLAIPYLLVVSRRTTSLEVLDA